MTQPAEQSSLHYAPVRILRPSGQRMGAPADADLQRINDVFAATELSADDIFVFNGVPSTDAVDTYYTHMDPATSLRNFVGDFTAGQSLQDSHETYVLGVGRSFRAELQPIAEAEGQPASQQVLAGYYIVRGLDLPKLGVSTDSYIRGIETGQWARLSNGFGGNEMRYICDIDGLDLWDSAYYPGQRLADGRYVTYAVVDAHSLESSIVFRNSTPGALIQRVQEFVDQRQAPTADIARIESNWHCRFDQPGKQFFGGRMPGQQQEQRIDVRGFFAAIDTRVGKKISSATREKLTSASSRLGDASGGIQEAADAIATLLEEVDADAEAGRMVRSVLGQDATREALVELQANANAGKAYRTDLIKETVQARVAVSGDTFDKERYEKRLSGYTDIDDLKDECEAWAGKRAATFRPGRQVPVEKPGEGAPQQPGEGSKLPEGMVEERSV